MRNSNNINSLTEDKRRKTYNYKQHKSQETHLSIIQTLSHLTHWTETSRHYVQSSHLDITHT